MIRVMVEGQDVEMHTAEDTVISWEQNRNDVRKLHYVLYMEQLQRETLAYLYGSESHVTVTGS